MRLLRVEEFSTPLPTPSADAPYTKGDQFAFPAALPPQNPAYRHGFAAGRVDSPKNFVKSVLKIWTRTGVRLEYYLLGTWVGNAKIIVWTRPVTAPTP